MAQAPSPAERQPLDDRSRAAERARETDSPGADLPSERSVSAAPPPAPGRGRPQLRQGAQQRSIAALQRVQGNRATARQIARLRGAPASAPLQRHPPGATLLGGTAREGAPPTPTPAQDASGGGSTPAELSMPTLRTAFAQEALQRAFGGVAGRQMITGNITVVADQAALYAQYDQIQIDNGVRNRDTGQPWVMGDKARWNDSRGLRTNAFAHGGSIWIDATQTDPTATVHEMLHVNTTSDFLSVVGRAINEGITQRLAVRAVSAMGHSVAGSESTYQSEQGVVSALVGVVGEPALLQAYFNGSSTLITAYESVMGADSFAVLKRTLNDTPEGYTAALALLQPPSVAQKVAAINTLLDWWVSDADLDIVESIVSTCSASDRQAVAAAIQPRITDLTSIGQRTRLRVILGTV